MVFYQRRIRFSEQGLVCNPKCRGRDENRRFQEPDPGLQLCSALEKREFTAVKFTKSSKNRINILLHMLQLAENQ